MWRIRSRDKKISYPTNVDTFCARSQKPTKGRSGTVADRRKLRKQGEMSEAIDSLSAASIDQSVSPVPKGKIHFARRIWRTTAKQTMVEEEVACWERRLLARPLQPSSTLFDRMIDDIDATEQTSPTEWEQMKQLKKDIIHQCIITGRGMAHRYHNDVLHEQKKKYFVKCGVDESTAEWQLEVIQAIETRRLHMLERST
ncbi:unnamed protein product [Didymodactylos carnosus]|uniref:Uncharacterized protein n=1 Tax=Didymodactylos carnosus TaxID=1234261 RepID=A0A8S2CQD3_9BILA|nr:unnamed protein product [Didymodactylos carnosus]CAF3494743.1 unnamed protein product [Didymodactylos carnosus]